MKNSLTFFSILFFSIIALASLENDAPPINSETKPVLKVTSKILYKEYNNNEIAADDKYKGKIIPLNTAHDGRPILMKEENSIEN